MSKWTILLYAVLSVFVSLPEVTCRPPHIIFIVADDLGWNDVGWHNNQMYTPNLDKLARAGVIFNSSYVQPVCTPSRNCFMTGYYPFHTGLQHEVIHPLIPGYLPANLTTLPQKLKELGYATHIVGKWHLGFCNEKYTPTVRGFDSFFGFYNGAEDHYSHVRDDGYDWRWNTTIFHPPPNKYSAEIITDHAISILNTIDPDTQPLYLYLPFQSVHDPLQVPDKYRNIYPNITLKSRQTYCGMVSALDEAVGNITQVLRSRGFLKNALLVFTTDNGGPTYIASNNLPLRGAKTTLWEGGTKGVSFVYSENLLSKTGYTNTEMIHAVDWFPTLLSLAGGTPSKSIDGRNQWKMISTGNQSARDEFVYNIDDILNNAAIRVGKYKLIQGTPGSHNGWTPLPPLTETQTQTPFPEYQLFDIDNDPTEHFNIADDNPEIVEHLKSRLEHYRKTMVPAHFPPQDHRGDPVNFNWVWSPGWC